MKSKSYLDHDYSDLYDQEMGDDFFPVEYYESYHYKLNETDISDIIRYVTKDCSKAIDENNLGNLENLENELDRLFKAIDTSENIKECEHKMKDYLGLLESYRYCEFCDEREK